MASRQPWGKLHYLDSAPEGTRSAAVIMLHGTGCSCQDWLPIIDTWRSFTLALPRVVAVDFRGHGDSDVPQEPFTLGDLAADIITLIGELKCTEVLLVGHSLGGMVALEAAASCPAIKGLALCEGWTRLSTTTAFDEGHMLGGLDTAAEENIKAKAAEVRAKFDAGHWDSFWQSVIDFDGLPALNSLTIPIVEAWGVVGRNDGTASMLLVPERPNITWQWIEGAGHYLPQCRPEEVAQMCEDLIRSL